MAFFDFDEFLVLKKHKDIHEYLSDEMFNDYDCVKINWMLYDDNDLIEDDGRPVNERLTRPCDYDIKIGYDFPQNYHVKSIVRGGSISRCKGGGWNPHVPFMFENTCNGDGIRGNTSPFQPYSYENAWIKHFSLKTLEEFINNKLVRGLGDRKLEDYLKLNPINDFFKLNKKTDEKIKYINDRCVNTSNIK